MHLKLIAELKNSNANMSQTVQIMQQTRASTPRVRYPILLFMILLHLFGCGYTIDP